MPKSNTRRLLYSVLLVFSTLLVSSSVLHPDLEDVIARFDWSDKAKAVQESKVPMNNGVEDSGFTTTSAMQPMFMTIIQGANEEVVCPNDGSTLAKFFLCGTSDIRTLTLSQSGSSYEWQRLDPNTCAPSVVEDCPTINTSCNWDTVGTNATYDLDAAGEYRVRVDSGQYYYFKATQNPLDPQLIFEDIICGNPGRVEVTNVPNGYEYSLNSPTGPFQVDPYFDITAAGDYTVYVRLQGSASSACLFPSNTVTVSSLDIDVQVSKNDILCSGEQGSIDVQVSGVPGFYTYRLIKNGVTVDTFGPDSADNYTFANVGSGTYTVRVETNKCDVTVTTDINSDPITIGDGISPLDVSTSASDSFGCGATSVDVTLTTSGGTAPYRYSLDGGANFSGTYTGSTVFSVTSSGTYNIIVEDANGCQRTGSIDVQDIPPPTFSTTAVDANCGGANDGQVIVNLTNGFGYAIEYSIDNGTNYQVSNVFSNLPPGTYDVMLRYTQDTFTCTTPSQSATVGTPSTISGTATADSNPSCGNETGGQISISGVSGGTGPYEYSVGAGFSTNPVFGNLGVGTYTPLIRDANGCVETLPNIVFPTLDKPTDLDFAISSLDCISTTASVTLTVTDGVAPYIYEIIAPAGSTINNGTNDTFTGLGLGTYTFRVTDSAGCSYDENYAITDISSIGALAQQISPITCFGDTDGEGRFLIDGFNLTYSYSIDGGTVFTGQNSSTIDLTGLAAGNYVISVTDEETNCTDTATLTIEGPAAPFAISSLDVEPMSCQNGNVGNVTVNTSGGWGGNSYELVQPDSSTRGPQGSPVFPNLTQDGTYTVTVTDLNGCSVTDTFSLSALSTPILTVDNAASDFCYDAFDAASLVVNASSGTAPYEYRINGGPLGASNTFSGLNPGTYTIEVVDANDCRDDVSVTIQPQITATATIIQELECSGPDGQIQVIISDGYPAGSNYVDYDVYVDGVLTSTNVPITGNSFVHTVPNDGSITTDTGYRFVVRDSQGCENQTDEVIITPQETISGTAMVTDTQCGDLSSGIVELIPDTTQGVPPYEYSDNGGATFGSQNVFSGYGPGTHSNFVIRDSRGCVSPPISATIATSDPLNSTVTVFDATCAFPPPTTTGSLTVDILNGTAPFDYEIYDISNTLVGSNLGTASTSESFPNLPPGDYTVITTDDSGCEDRDVATISQNQLDLIPLDTPPATCADPFLSYRVQAVGGTGPYEFRLVGDPTFVLANVNAFDIHDFSAVVTFGVTYFVEVRDANGCTYIEEILPITPPSPINVAATSTSASCNPGGTGEIFFDVTGISPSPADFTIELQNTDTGATISGPTTFTNEPIPYSGSFTGLPAGNYQIIVNDLNSQCSASDLVLITEDIPNIAIDSNIAATCNTGALITVRGFGGTAPYEFAYVVTGNPAPSTFDPATTYNIPGPYPTTYDFYVRDANGCTSFITATVTEDPGVPVPTIDVINQCTATSGYQINVTAPLTTGSGLPEDTFEYNIGSGYQSSPNFVVPNPGSYVITIRDGNGCLATISADVFDFFSITADATSVPTCNAGDGVITVTTSGGSGNFEFQLRDAGTLLPIGPPQSSNTFTSIAPGDYDILVTDLSSNTVPLCTDNSVVTVSTVDTPIITATPSTAISCFGADDATISVELQPGSDTDTPLSYVLYDGGTTTIVAGPQGSALFDNLGPGTYQVEVVSNRGCSDRSTDIVITEPTLLQLATSNTEFICNPSNNQFSTATITAFVDTNGDGTGTTTGTGPYTYSMNDGTPAFDGTNFQTSNVFEVIDNGTNQSIIITVRDQSGCETTSNVNINTPTDLTFSFSVGSLTCDASGSGVSPGTIDIIIDQGPGNYEVEILPLGSEPARNSGGTDRVTWDIATPGDYIFAVTDISSGGCTYLTPIVTMPEYNTIEATIAEVRPVTCFNGNDGEISLSIANYSGVYNYEVFSRDNAGVETTTGVTGSFDTNAPISTPEVITGLPAGNLVVHVEALDVPFCDVISNVATVRSPDRALTVVPAQTADVTCNVPGLGEITLTGDGGWGGYEFRLEDSSGTVIQDFPDTNDIISGLSDDTYTITIRDSMGCEVVETFVLSPPVPIAADIQVVSPLRCNNDNDGVIEAFNISGGQGAGNYLYQLNRLVDGTSSGLQTSPTFANLSAGDYTITVFDGWNCSFTTIPINVQDPEIVIAELVELQPPGCGDLGRMLLTVTNPEPGVDYFYRRSGTADPFAPFGAGLTSVEIAVDITIDPGPFLYDVQNSNGCPFERSNQISLDPAAPLVISLDLTNATINCAGEATGIIRGEAFGGIGNYTYSLLNSDVPGYPTPANTVRGSQDSGIFRNLEPGTYYVFARSGGCEAISPPIVIDPKPPLVMEYFEVQDALCFGEANGQIILEASGGTGVIRYSISDTLSEFFEGDDPDHPNRKTFDNLAPRQYDIIVQDELGCTITQTVTIGEPMELVAGVADATPETCLGDGDGTITLEIEGGTAPYFTSVNSADDIDFVQDDDFFFDNLLGGETYVIYVRDSAGCETNVVVPVGIGIDLIAEPVVEYGCDGIFPNSTARVEITDGALIPDLLFALDVDDISLATDERIFGDLPPGPHTVYIYHANGCATFVEFTIDAYQPLTLEAEKTGPNELTAIATGGFGDYEFFFQGQSYGETNTFTINEDMDINVMVRDRMGCVANLVMPFDFDGMPEFPDFFTPDGDNLNDYWYPENSEFFSNIEVKIYDRYGRVVAILKDVKGWDGTYEGSPLPTGDYWYVVNANDRDQQQFVGHFTLYR